MMLERVGSQNIYGLLLLKKGKMNQGSMVSLLIGNWRGCCLVFVRLSPRPSRSIDFGDVSETNGTAFSSQDYVS